MRLLAALLVASLGLVGCRTLGPPAAVDPASAASAQRARAQALGLAEGDCAAPGWVMAGRVALSNGRDGGSGQIEWTQGAGSTRMMLSAPITRQSWVLEVDASGATLEGVPNGPLRGADAGLLLRDTTGWDIPVAALGCWLRGVAAGAPAYGAASVQYGADLLPLRIEQGGWRIDFADWRPDPFSRLPMPSRITAQRGDDRVRLLVSRWGLE